MKLLFLKPKERTPDQEEKDAQRMYSSLQTMGTLLGTVNARKRIITTMESEYKKLIKRIAQEKGEVPTVGRLIRNTPKGILLYGSDIGLEEEHFKVLAREALQRNGHQVIED